MNYHDQEEELFAELSDTTAGPTNLLHPFFVQETKPDLELPRGGQLHTDHLSRMYYTLFALNHGKPFGFKLLSALLRIATMEQLKELNCATTPYYLNKSEQFFSPQIKQDHFEFPNKGKGTCYDLNELTAFLLSKKDLSSNWISSSSSAPLSHIANGAGKILFVELN